MMTMIYVLFLVVFFVLAWASRLALRKSTSKLETVVGFLSLGFSAYAFLSVLYDFVHFLIKGV